MTLDHLYGTLAILTVASSICVYLVPKTSQDRLDAAVNSLSERVRELTFWNFTTIERDVAFSWLQAIFKARVNSPRFYLNVAKSAVYATALALVPYLFVPFSDPLNVPLVGYPIFLLMGFFVPSVIVAIISMGCTVALLSVGARLKNGLFYLIIVAIDIFAVVTLIAALSINLELTRDHLEAVYLGRIYINLWLILYQPFLTIGNVLLHPGIAFQSISAEIYIFSKYTTYWISMMSAVCAVMPAIVHLMSAVFILLAAIFHNVLKHIASFLLARMYEQRTFKFLQWFFGLPLACIAGWKWFLSTSV